VDVGGTKILAGIVDPAGTVEHRRERPTELDSQDRLIEEIGAAAEELLDDSVAAVGFGLPSRIDQQAGCVDGSVNTRQPYHAGAASQVRPRRRSVRLAASASRR